MAVGIGKSLHDLLELRYAFEKAEVEDDIVRAIIDDPRVMRAAIEGAERYLRAVHETELAMERQNILSMDLSRALSLSTRTRNILLRHGMKTVGDVCMRTPSMLLEIRGLSIKTLLEIEKALVTNGLDLMNERAVALTHVVTLFGNAEFVPSKLMPMWVPGLDGRTKDILDKYPTLGDLSIMSAREFMDDEYGHPHGELLATTKRQMVHVRDGLRAVGLEFRGED